MQANVWWMILNLKNTHVFDFIHFGHISCHKIQFIAECFSPFFDTAKGKHSERLPTTLSKMIDTYISFADSPCTSFTNSKHKVMAVTIRLGVNMLNFSVFCLFLVFIFRRIVRVFSSIFAQKIVPLLFWSKSFRFFFLFNCVQNLTFSFWLIFTVPSF